MKKIISLFLGIFIIINVHAQQNPFLNVKKHTLKNGLTVLLNEDNSKPEVFGAVVVNAGSKHDPKDATGIAHYFEHMMFKGTDKIGTIDWESEKLYLDSIVVMYDNLGATKDEEERKLIQKEINRLSIKAAQYAIPNEVDIILQNIGGTGLNAYTSFEQTVYFNKFPSNQMEKWLEIYAERFRKPVFRLFQSELETVYEEKNMYSDNRFAMLFETFLKNFFKNHPYGQQTTIGTTEHLKNPSLSKMQDFFDTYYVANNMTLILTGNFRSEDIMPIIEEKYGSWPSGSIPAYPVYEEKAFKGREALKVKSTPIAIGIMGFRTVPNNHQDELSLDLCADILSNESETGLLDKLTKENKILAMESEAMKLNDHGVFAIIFIPKIIGQKLSSAEKLALTEIENLRKGNFSDELLEGVKLNYKKRIERQLESSQGRAMLMIQCASENRQWEDMISISERVDKITKEEVVRVANKYLNENYFILNSKMGFPAKDKIDKPDWDPIVPQNSEKKSEYAQMIDKIDETPLEPKYINFEKEVSKSNLRSGITYYHTPNPYNDIFTLSFKYKVGDNKNNKISYAADYMNEIGTTKSSVQELKSKLQMLGANVRFYANDNYTYINIEGFDSKLNETLEILAELLTSPKMEKKPLKYFVHSAKSEYKTITGDADMLSDALADYVRYGEKSDYIDKLTVKEISKLKGEELIEIFKEVLLYEAEIHYVGSLYEKDVKNTILRHIPFALTPQKQHYEELFVKEFQKPEIYIYNYPKSVQSKIYLFANGEVVNEDDKAFINAFNEYFGGGMSSIVFQEIREFRSLGYSAYAYYTYPNAKGKKGHLFGYLGTQNDKVLEALDALYGLIKDMPVKPDRIDVIKRGLVQGIHTQNPSFRYVSNTISNWEFLGYDKDPRESRMEVYEKMNFDDIVKTYSKFIKDKPIVISIVGDFSKIDKEELKKFGEIKELKLKEFIVK